MDSRPGLVATLPAIRTVSTGFLYRFMVLILSIETSLLTLHAEFELGLELDSAGELLLSFLEFECIGWNKGRLCEDGNMMCEKWRTHPG